MEGYSNSYQNGSVSKEAEFQRLAQSIGTNIQKMIQNGNTFQICFYFKYLFISNINSFQIYFRFKYQFTIHIFSFQISILITAVLRIRIRWIRKIRLPGSGSESIFSQRGSRIRVRIRIRIRIKINWILS